MKKIFFSVLFLVYIFQKEYACGFLHSWPPEDTLRHYGLSEVHIKKIKNSLEKMMRIKDSLIKLKDAEYETLVKIIEEEKINFKKLKKSKEKIKKYWGEILEKDIKFYLEMKNFLSPELFRRIKKYFKIGRSHKYLKEEK